MGPILHNVAVVGYGLSAKARLPFPPPATSSLYPPYVVFHIPLIQSHPSFTLHAIVQRHPTPINDASHDHPDIKIYTTTEAMLQDPAVGVVVITTIPTSHFEICKLALEHGKHVIVEKPFTPTAREAGALIASAQKCDRLLSVYQNRRWDADFLTLRKLLDEKRLGRVVEFESHFDRYRPIAPSAAETWKAKPLPGGGVLYDLGSHLIDQVLVLFGTPERITGFVGSQREGGVEDWFTVMLHYEAGFVATVKAGCLSAEVDQLRFWLRGVGGSYWKFHLDPQEDQLKARRRPGDVGFGVEPAKHAGTLTSMQGDTLVRESCPNIEPVTYGAFYTGFAKALEGQMEVPVRPEGAREVIRLVELARLSSRERRTLNVRGKYEGID